MPEKSPEGKLKGIADRVIMNLPETAIDFVDAACNAIKPEGGVAHFYGFVRQPDTIENLKQRFTEKVEQNGRTVEYFLHAKSIRETAPFESQIVLDARNSVNNLLFDTLVTVTLTLRGQALNGRAITAITIHHKR